ncbi:hypothetical protein [Mycolicibacterium novocastrense]|uniref:Uncharacterized protein n=1 Tax=Mycolicibacterium novocastrense TaxID=59813 RepID=A0ABQ0KF81_MYCNV|nr:hypothetical protein [Mycolicibacterium novocastrense]GAT08100.1 uncharacterized protein RMCN_1233 [Mycolicibacterium novocastrense]
MSASTVEADNGGIALRSLEFDDSPAFVDATPAVAAAITTWPGDHHGGHLIDTTRPLADSVAEAQQICCTAI